MTTKPPNDELVWTEQERTHCVVARANFRGVTKLLENGELLPSEVQALLKADADAEGRKLHAHWRSLPVIPKEFSAFLDEAEAFEQKLLAYRHHFYH